ncbi:uncharacterized protein [Ptychodera flava]
MKMNNLLQHHHWMRIHSTRWYPLLPEKFPIPVNPISPLPVRKRACTLSAEPDAVTNEPTSTLPYVKEKVTVTTGTQIRMRNKRRSKGITVKPQVCHVGIQCNISDAVEQGSNVQSHTGVEIVSVCGDRVEEEYDYDDDGGDDDDDDDDDDEYDNNSDECDGDESTGKVTVMMICTYKTK